MFGGNFAIRGWALCDGQLLAIAQNSALFSILGTTYGGDGRTSFGLPDLRGRAAMHPGNGPGLSSRRLGEKGGAETTTLLEANMPTHTHSATLFAENKAGTVGNPVGNMLGRSGADTIYAAPDPGANKAMGPDSVAIGATGGGQSFNNVQPYLCVNYLIALQGIFPSRN